MREIRTRERITDRFVRPGYLDIRPQEEDKRNMTMVEINREVDEYWRKEFERVSRENMGV